MHIFKQLGGAATIIMGLSTQVLACDVEYALAYDLDLGGHNVRLNGLLIDTGGPGRSVIPLEDGLIEGENTIAVLYNTLKPTNRARYALLKRCAGQAPDPEPVARMEITGEAEQSMSFLNEAAVRPVFPGAEATDGRGLREAVEKLRTAVATGDEKTVMAMHAPYFNTLRADRGTLRKTKAHIRRLLRDGSAVLVPNYELMRASGGYVYEVRGPLGVPPVSVSIENEGRFEDWTSGTRWIFVEGGWAVLKP